FRKELSTLKDRDARRQAVQKYFDSGRSVVSAQSLEDMTKAIEADPEWAEAWAERGRLLLLLGNVSKSLADLKKALELNPSSSMAQYWYGKALESSGDQAAAATHYEEAVRLHPKSSHALLATASSLARQGKIDEAMDACNKILALDWSSAEAYLARGGLFLLKGDTAAALADFEKVASINPLSPAAWNSVGNVHHRGGDLRCALDNYNRALELNSECSEAIFNRANICYQTGRLDAALGGWEKFLKLEGEDGPLGKGVREHATHTAELKSGTVEPCSASEYAARGCYRILERRFREGADDFERILRHEPQSGSVHSYLALLYEGLAQKGEKEEDKSALTEKAAAHRKAESLLPPGPADPWMLPISNLMADPDASTELP
ncbi:MAG: tetratricopeptide repeat protein, partial [Planctomycetota bacterium]|nr:tetratricopeptide repeat protein [Planctomycetota bacterium]